MKSFKLTYKPYGKSAILIEWPHQIDEIILENILIFKNEILKNKIKVIVEVISSYNSLTIFYGTTIENLYNEILDLKAMYAHLNPQKKAQKNCWHIPVCYAPVFGLDLEECVLKYKLDIKALINLHTTPFYTVYCIGFLPGFLYLGGLDAGLHFARKAKPRNEVIKGAVGIGGQQTGVYPQNSPGGWNIIGNSPISFFEAKKKEPCFAKVGDKIKFFEVDKKEHQKIQTQVQIGFYQIKNELLNA